MLTVAVLIVLLGLILAADFEYGMESPASYYRAVEKAKAGSDTSQGCGNIEHNVVYCCVHNLDNVHRDWTMDGGLVERMVNSKDLPMCASIDEVIDSVKGLVAERKCNVPYFTPTDVCRAMSRNSNVIFAGECMYVCMYVCVYIVCVYSI